MEEATKILIVDDEQLIRRALQRIFADARYDTVLASNGLEALEKAWAEDPPDVILLDINMPGMDGRDVLTRLRADERTKSVPTLFLTARGGHIARLHGLELGADDYFEKPFDPTMLRRRVDRLMKKIRAMH